MTDHKIGTREEWLEARLELLKAEKGLVFLFDREADSLIFSNVDKPPVPSLLRGFSAPVKLSLDLGNGDLLAMRSALVPIEEQSSAGVR